MNQDETIALFLQGKEAWNAWAEKMLAERKAMEANGSWAVEKYDFEGIGPKNEKTRAWMNAASADFSCCVFPVQGAKEVTEETKGGGSVPSPVKSIFLDADAIDFGDFIFPGDANFLSTAFSSRAYFHRATFSGGTNFHGATFSGDAWFRNVTFSGDSNFRSVSFSSDANFENATFSRPADFRNAAFSKYANFVGAAFSGPADFGVATFSSAANFGGTAFSADAYFRSAIFTGPAYFQRATFRGNAWFQGQTFKNDIFFNGAKFETGSNADFGIATFERAVQFNEASFEGEADFNAVSGERTFSMARARFKSVPDFIQAHFDEAPRLDNVMVEGRLLEEPAEEPEDGEKLPRRTKLHRWLQKRVGAPYRRAHYNYRRVKGGVAEGSALRDMPARWRALKRLAIQGHDTDRELQFFSGEIRSQRFAEHWPLPWPVWKLKPWGGALSFWAGLFYQTFSNFGRSLARPFFFWLLAVVAGAIFYAAQSPSADMVHRRTRQEEKGAWPITSSISGAWHAWLSKRVPCYAGEPTPPKDKNGDMPPYVGTLSPSQAKGTDVANEAWHLAFRNAFIVLDGSSEAAHRTYGCLYGVELYGGSNPLAVVPSAVSTVSAVQKLFSALMIFLFGLALRNMLKMK